MGLLYHIQERRDHFVRLHWDHHIDIQFQEQREQDMVHRVSGKAGVILVRWEPGGRSH